MSVTTKSPLSVAAFFMDGHDHAISESCEHIRPFVVDVIGAGWLPVRGKHATKRERVNGQSRLRLSFRSSVSRRRASLVFSMGVPQ